MKDENGRLNCVLFTSCLGHGIAFFLQQSADFNRRYALRPYIFHGVTFLADLLPKMEPHLGDCAVFIHHEPEAYPHQLYEETFARVQEKLAPGAVRISLPLPHFYALWPFECNDPRNGCPDRPLNRYGLLPEYHYGDNYVLGLLKQGVPPEEVIARYLTLDVSSEIDLDALLRGTLSMIERNERRGPVKVADFVGSVFRSEKLFLSSNHPNNRLLLYMANQILKAIGCEKVPESILASLTEIIEESVPIHPSVGRYYGMNFIDTTTRYQLDEIRYLNFAEFIRDYVYYKDGLIS
jgi:hypothetical protein